MSDHSAVTLQLNSFESNAKGRGCWKLNTSYLTEEAYIKGIRNLKPTCEEEYKDMGEDRLKWELMKFRITEYSVKYGIEKAKKVSSEEKVLEEELRALEAQKDAVGNSMPRAELDNQMTQVRSRLQEISDYKTEGLILRSQARWYEKGKKSNNYFLRLESRNKVKKNINKLQKYDGTITIEPKEILKMEATFYTELYSSKWCRGRDDIQAYLDGTNTPVLTDEEQKDCEGMISLEECHKALKTFQNNKSLGNDDLPAEFYKTFWPEFGSAMVNAFNNSF